LPLFVQLMGKNVRNNFLEPRASAGETGRRELLVTTQTTTLSFPRRREPIPVWQ
jgi:hypothetical protein